MYIKYIPKNCQIKTGKVVKNILKTMTYRMRKAGIAPSHPPIIEDETPFVPTRSWAEVIRKVYEVVDDSIHHRIISDKSTYLPF